MKLTFKNIQGKSILVGITFLARDGSLLSMVQFSGKIIRANQKEGIVILSENLKAVLGFIPASSQKYDDTIYKLPPDFSALQVAPEGEYRLKSTGEIVMNPNFLTTWTVTEPV